jgi:hypothetical protein
MYGVSEAFIRELRKSSMLVDVQVIASDGTVLAIQDGNVDMDTNRSITRTATLTLTPTDTLTAIGVFNLVMTPEIEITIRRGLIINGVTEYVTLGVFSTDSADFSIDVEGAISWSGSDRSKKISRARFIDAYQISKNSSLATAGAALLSSRYSAVITNFSNVVDTIDAQLVFDAGPESNPWQSARTLFADHGYDLHFDGDGTAVAMPVPDPATSESVFDFGSAETNLMLDATISGTLEQTYNGVVATGEGTGNAAPSRAVVWDTDPNSPTYYQGGYGQVPLFYSSPLLTTTTKCTAAATTLLAKAKGRASQLAWSAVPNPALEPLDVVNLEYNGTQSKFVIDAITIPLRASDPITAKARETSTVPFQNIVISGGSQPSKPTTRP